MTAKTVTDASFQQEVIEAGVPVLVDFWAPWCGPCKMLGPIVDEVAQEKEGQVKVVKIDVDQNTQTATTFNVRTIPTMILFKDGQPVDTKIGMLPKNKVIEWVESAAK